MDHDTLSDVLRNVRLRGAVFFSVSGSSDWVAEAPPARQIAPLLLRGVEHVMEYHAVAAGTCWAGDPGRAVGAARRRRRRHVPARRRARRLERAGHARRRSTSTGSRRSHGERWPVQVTYDGLDVSRTAPAASDGADATIVCGFLGCDLQPFNPLIDALPRMLHLRAGSDDAWIAQFAQQAIAESRAQRPGGEAMLARMSEMMFVDAVRRYADTLARRRARAGSPACATASSASALALMHEQPAHDWTHRRARARASACRARRCTSASCSWSAWRRCSTSRSGACRPRRACCSRRASTVAAIALDVGYDSEAAFARAFKRVVGKPPAAWRREREGQAG